MEITITGEISKHIKSVEELAKKLGLFVSGSAILSLQLLLFLQIIL